MKWVKRFGQLVVLTAMATVIAQAIVLSVVVMKGTVNQDKVYKSLAIMYDVKEYPLVSRTASKDERIEIFPSLEEVDEQRTVTRLNLVLKESSLDKGLSDLMFLDDRLKEDVKAFNQIKGQFDSAILQREKAALNEGIRQVRRNVEVMRPKQAKDTLLKIIESSQEGIREAAAIVRAMSPDKRKKILSAFKEPAEEDTLFELLNLILVGDSRLIDDAQKQLNEQFRSNTL